MARFNVKWCDGVCRPENATRQLVCFPVVSVRDDMDLVQGAHLLFFQRIRYRQETLDTAELVDDLDHNGQMFVDPKNLTV